MSNRISSIDPTTEGAHFLSEYIIEALSKLNPHDHKIKDILGALALVSGYFIDHGTTHNDKQFIYEAYIRCLAEIMATAPGINK